LPVTVDRSETPWIIRLDGEVTLASAPELKKSLMEWLASGNDLQLDLERVADIDVTLLQLLWAAGREALRSGATIASRVPESAGAMARDAGFDRFPGPTEQA